MLLDRQRRLIAPLFIHRLVDGRSPQNTPAITLCRVKRHLISTTSQQHGSHAETKPAPAFYTHHQNTRLAKATHGHKLYSKVLAIEPNRLLRNLAGFAIGAAEIWTMFKIFYISEALRHRPGQYAYLAYLQQTWHRVFCKN